MALLEPTLSYDDLKDADMVTEGCSRTSRQGKPCSGDGRGMSPAPFSLQHVHAGT